MIKFLAGTIFGIVISTIGLSGLFSMGDKIVDKSKDAIKEMSK